MHAFEAIAIGSRSALALRPELATMPKGKHTCRVVDRQSRIYKVTGSDGANAIARLRGRIHYVEEKLTIRMSTSDLTDFFADRFAEIESYLEFLQNLETAVQNGTPTT